MGEALDLGYQTEHMTNEVFELYWPHISQELDRVPHIWQRYFTKEYLYQAPLAGQFDVWGVGPDSQIRLIVYTRILDCPASRILQLTLALGNDVEACLPSLTATLEKLANDAGCQYCEIVGRLGWERLLPGFKRTEVVLTRSLEHFKVQ